MTIKKRIFWTNSLMVFMALLVMLMIGGIMLSVFKDRFLGWYSQNSKISEDYIKAYQAIDHLELSSGDWKEASRVMQTYDFRMIVRDAGNKTVFQNARHNEEEGAEALFGTATKEGTIESYLIENTTILAIGQNVDGEFYDVYFVHCPDEKSIFGMDRGMFEQFIFIFLGIGIIVILVILFLSQLLTRMLIRKILEPVNALNQAARRITDGDLDTAIRYEKKDEFQNVCDSFDLMQTHLKEETKKNQAYEKARTEMVSGISHDLRTPLTSIKGYIKGMMDGVANTEEKRQEYLGIAYRKSCDMERLLSKLFYFSKLETGNMPFYMQKEDMEAYVADYIAEKEVELTEKNAVIRGRWRLEAPILCEIDRTQIQRVFDNLIENSCKYAKPEEELEIEIQMQASKEERWLKIRFKDNGKGMDADKIPHVFEQFYRGDEARNSACGGNGLGLYVCRYIVEKHGGSIQAENAEGFQVTITLPLCQTNE